MSFRTLSSASTIRVNLQFLRTALRWAGPDGQKMMAQLPKFPTIKVPKRKPQPVPGEAFEKLLDKARDQETRAYLLCGWLAGLRECAGVEVYLWYPHDWRGIVEVLT